MAKFSIFKQCEIGTAVVTYVGTNERELKDRAFSHIHNHPEGATPWDSSNFF
jgi:hypothetical protein